MAKKRKFEDLMTPQEKELVNFKLKDLKRACIIRGLKFGRAVRWDVHKLSSWFLLFYYNDIKYDRLNKFDDWVEVSLKKRGKLDLIHPQLRLGFIGEKDEDGKVTKVKRVKGLKKRKTRRARTPQGVFQGTKKAYTMELVAKGLSKERVVRKVLRKFPDASEKSIGIWFNKANKKK